MVSANFFAQQIISNTKPIFFCTKHGFELSMENYNSLKLIFSHLHIYSTEVAFNQESNQFFILNLLS